MIANTPKMNLTEFQIQCEKNLLQAFHLLGKSITNRKPDGQTETDITGNIAEEKITFWIYQDGADWKSSGEHRLFEKPDYRSLDDLSSAFIASILNAVEQDCNCIIRVKFRFISELPTPNSQLLNYCSILNFSLMISSPFSASSKALRLRVTGMTTSRAPEAADG
jgi:hypothetical protein